MITIIVFFTEAKFKTLTQTRGNFHRTPVGRGFGPSSWLSSPVPSTLNATCKIGKGLPYSIPSVGHGADLIVQAVSPQVTVSRPPGGRLPFLSTRPAVTFPAAEHHRRLAGTKLYCLVTEVHRCEQLAQGCYTALPQV